MATTMADLGMKMAGDTSQDIWGQGGNFRIKIPENAHLRTPKVAQMGETHIMGRLRHGRPQPLAKLVLALDDRHRL